MKPYTKKDKWIFHTKRNRNHYKEPQSLCAYWEIVGDPISDDYDYQVPAEELIDLWIKWLSKNNYLNDTNLLPIYWYVASFDAGTFEGYPFSYAHSPALAKHNFLQYFNWPIHAQTGEPINWLRLPVIDKLWRKNKMMKGGFIQEYTGWKPGIYQPFVYLQSLLQREL